MRYYLALLIFVMLSPAAFAGSREAIALAQDKKWVEAKVQAVASGNDTLEVLVDWLFMQDADGHASFDEITQFMQAHPNWPDMNRLRVRAEMSLRESAVIDEDIIRYFDASPPVTGVGKWAYVEALQKQKQKPELYKKLIKEAWRDADLSVADEAILLMEFGSELNAQDHIARVDRLLWENKIKAAERTIPKVPQAYQTMFAARIAMMNDEKRASALVLHISGKLALEPGFMYERMKFRARKGDDKGVREMLLAVPKEVPYPERWWKLRESQIHGAIADSDYKMAMKLLANHGQSEAANLATADWLKGWVKLSFLNNARGAYDDFSRMYDEVKYPVSRARAAYWAARAAQKLGDAESANQWFASAGKYPTAFYGQLALSKINNDKPLALPAEPSLEGGSIPPDLAEAIKLSVQAGADSLATRLIKHVIDTADNESTVLAVAKLGHELHAPHISVKAAKRAAQQGVVLKDVGYPRPKTDASLPLERPLTLGIIRQESEFDPQAESPSGALGMMQLLKGTARDTAKKIDAAYLPQNLLQPDYNILLGSNYLSRMVNAFDGSYILGIASYNAGPGNVKKWRNRFGAPPKDVEGAVNWIETIPFEETRNYVERVMENIQVYRALDDENATLGLRDDLAR